MKAVDMHCDTIGEIHDRRREGETICLRESRLHVDLEKMRAGDYLLQNFAVFVHLGREKRPFEYAMETIDTFYGEMGANRDVIAPVRSWADIERNRAEGRMSALLTLEEGGACQGNLAYLRDFYRLGVRMMTLTWNFPNELAWPNRVREGEPDEEHGLTGTGIEFVREMERLGMIVDVSHLGDAGFWDVARHTRRPFVASHSNCRALVPGCPRNLTDAMLRTLAERGGVAGINFCADFLRPAEEWKDGERKMSRLSDMVRHMKHMRRVGGIGCIGLGSDFDGIGDELEMGSAAGLQMLAEEMRRQGFTETETEAVFSGNVLRVYREILG